MTTMVEIAGPAPMSGADKLYNRLVIQPGAIPPRILPFDKTDIPPSEYISTILDTCGPSLLADKTSSPRTTERAALPLDDVFYTNAIAAAQELAMNNPDNSEYKKLVVRHLPQARQILLTNLLNEARGYLKQGQTPTIAARLLLLNAEHPAYTSRRVPALLHPDDHNGQTILNENRNAMRIYIRRQSDTETRRVNGTIRGTEALPHMDGAMVVALMEAHLFSYWITDKTPPMVQLARARRLWAVVGRLTFRRRQLPEFAEEAKNKARAIIKSHAA